jgi:hypothetical protein
LDALYIIYIQMCSSRERCECSEKVFVLYFLNNSHVINP